MAISKTWLVHDSDNQWAWVSRGYCSLLAAAYLVNGIDPASPGADHPLAVHKALRDMQHELDNNSYRYWWWTYPPSDSPPESKMVTASFVRKWANYYGLTDFFEPKPDQSDKPLTENERNTMLKLIFGMAKDAYGYDPSKSRNSATGENGISARLQIHDILITDDTIRKYLKEAKELL